MISLFILTINETYSQSYHYFNVSLPVAQDSSLNYKIFVSLELDGSANARIIYKNPINQVQKLVSQNYSPILESDSSTTFRFLSANSEKEYISGIEDTNYVETRIQLKTFIENEQTYYEPETFEFKDLGNKWQASEILESKTYTFDDLMVSKNFLSFFYLENDPFYQYLTNSGFRGSLSFFERMSRLHLINVANTLDNSIGSSSKKDLDKTHNLFSKLTQSMNIELLETTISGSDFNTRNVKRALRKLKVNSNDIIVFYYSGHGFRLEGDVSKYPRISLRTDKSQAILKNNYVLEDIHKTLLAKKAQVTIVIGDCCNEKIDVPIPDGMEVLTPRSNKAVLKLNVDNCRKLFFPQRPLSIIVGSAKVNQLAIGNPKLGGFFTHFFMTELEQSMFSTKGSSSWPNLLSVTRKNASFQATSARCSGKVCRQVAEIGFRQELR